jgi:hypothetical protein
MGLLKTYIISVDISDGSINNPKRLNNEINLSGFVDNFLNIVIDKKLDRLYVYGLSLTDESALDNLVLNHESETLDELKERRFSEIDKKTEDLIIEGFEYPASSGKIFSLSEHAQINILALDNTRDELTYPVHYTTKDELQEYDVVDSTDMHNMYLTALVTKKTHLDSGTSLKNQIVAAVDKNEVNLVVDNR